MTETTHSPVPLKILMFVNNNVSFDVRVLKEARTLLKHGYEVTVIGVQDRDHVPLTEIIGGARVIRIPRKGWYAWFWKIVDSSEGGDGKTSGPKQYSIKRGFPSSILQKLKRIWIPYHRELVFRMFYQGAADYASIHPADVWHIHDLNALPLLRFTNANSRPKVVYDSHELYTELATLTSNQRKKYQTLEKRWIKSVDEVITVNESIAEELVKRYEIPRPTVVMNCPERQVEQSPHSIELRQQYQIPDGDRLILFQGGFTDGRGLEQLIEAMNSVKGAVLVLLGWGPLKGLLQEMVDTMNLSGKVVFMNAVPQDQLLSISRQADIGVIPYRAVGLNNYFTSPNKLFEYIHAGIAVVGSDYPELRKVFDRYGVGRTFNPDSPLSIAETIQGLVDDPQALEELRSNTTKAADALQWRTEADKLIQLYLRLGNS